VITSHFCNKDIDIEDWKLPVIDTYFTTSPLDQLSPLVLKQPELSASVISPTAVMMLIECNNPVGRE
jgi:hypothetical protein